MSVLLIFIAAMLRMHGNAGPRASRRIAFNSDQIKMKLCAFARFTRTHESNVVLLELRCVDARPQSGNEAAHTLLQTQMNWLILST